MRKKNKYMPAVIVCIILMFLLILPAAVITKGKQEVSDLTALESGIILGLIAAEIAVVVIMFVFAFKAGKENDRIRAEMGKDKKEKPTKLERALKTRGWIIIIASFLFAGGLALFGAFFGTTEAGKAAKTPMLIAFYTAFAVSVLELALSRLSAKKFADSFSEMSVAQKQEFFINRRRFAREDMEKSMAELKRIRHGAAALAVFMFLLAVFMVFAAGAYLNYLFVPILFWSAAIMSSCIARLPFKVPEVFVEEQPGCTQREDFPVLYSLAEKAASDLNCNAEIRIRFFPDSGIGVADLGRTVMLQLGIYTLCQLSKEELVSILHHEFSHIMSSKTNSEIQYMNSRMGAPDLSAADLETAIFKGRDMRYLLKYNFFRFATSIIFEEDADKAMTLTCDKETAASALIKAEYFERYMYEDRIKDQASPYFYETPDIYAISKEFGRFCEAKAERQAFWDSLISKQILSRFDSHPTLDMRLKALGVSEYRSIEPENSPEFASELDKALEFVDRRNADLFKEGYKKARKERYLDNLNKIEEWKKQGEPILADGYRDIVDALEWLGRYEEAETVFDRAIEQLPDAAKHFALFKKGGYMLHRYDDGGIELIYRAIELNRNYIDGGLAEIGEYCCLTGNEAELERYKEMELELCQKQEDEYDKIEGLYKGDKLTKEELPSGVLERDLAFIRSVDKDCIEKIFLVRKTVSEDFFTSAYVVKFKKGTDYDTRDEITDRIFNYLDTISDWQYSLFDYDFIPNVGLERIEGSLVYERNR